MSQSAGMMVNYNYIMDLLESNSQQYEKSGTIAMSEQISLLAKKYSLQLGVGAKL